MRHDHPWRERMREWRLPAPERRAAKLARATEERMRSERDWYCERSRQLDRMEAERLKWSGFLF